jgi:hypothetical protein
LQQDPVESIDLLFIIAVSQACFAVRLHEASFIATNLKRGASCFMAVFPVSAVNLVF